MKKPQMQLLASVAAPQVSYWQGVCFWNKEKSNILFGEKSVLSLSTKWD